MCELMGCQFAQPVQADFSIREFARRDEENADGWGLAWYVDLPAKGTFEATPRVADGVIYITGSWGVVHAAGAGIHRMHHADTGFDLTTGLRFHPLEILLSMIWKAAVVVALGAPALAVLIFEIVLNGSSMFNHSNVRIPTAVDGVLRYFLVTPDMHRVHHSIYRDETDRNFGFNLPWWDHMFGTYRGQPRSGHEQMTIGIPSFRLPDDCATLTGLLAMPFIAERSAPSGRRKDLSDSQTS